MAITLVAPGGRRQATPRTAAPRLASLQNARLGLLGNGKAGAQALLEETATLFGGAFGCTVAGFVDKRNASRPALPEHHRTLAAGADLLVTAVGD